jgi:lysophospholipase L1-like esterase
MAVRVSAAVREQAVTHVETSMTQSASSPFLYSSALRNFFGALDEQQDEHGAGAAPERTVRVLQFGDSHTAADIFTGKMRASLQQQFGDGGLGFQFPGHPFAGYHLAGSLRSQTSGWFTEGNHFGALGDGDLGLGGISISTSRPGESITLEAPCTTLQLQFLEQPGGGRMQFSDNGVAMSVIGTDLPGGAEDANAAPTAGTFSYSCSPGVHDFEFATLDNAPVKLLGVVTQQPGVTYECLGINGAVAPLMLRWNQNLFSDYLRQSAPSLIVLAYGTNESGSSAEHLEDYPEQFAQVVDNLHRIAPEASVLVLGPADRSMRAGRRGPWKPYPGTDRIIAMQKEVCQTHRCAYWDTRRRMGGFGSMQQWVTAGWAQPDRTHLTGTGYRTLADALYEDLMRAYNQYQQQPEAPLHQSSVQRKPAHPAGGQATAAPASLAQESSNG